MTAPAMQGSRKADDVWNIEKLAAFGAWALVELRTHPGSDLDGGDAQDKAVEFGVLEIVPVIEACGDGCACAEWDDFPQDCYRYPDWFVAARKAVLERAALSTLEGGT